ncbi:MAG: hypothetical protein KJ879_02155, partial [Nanoarchaeota archaeon]|nr:hypothetical protein [Nanoarchaeota archaeon]
NPNAVTVYQFILPLNRFNKNRSQGTVVKSRRVEFLFSCNIVYVPIFSIVCIFKSDDFRTIYLTY